MNRVLEPELMTDPDQAQAYAAADFATVNQGFVDRFRASFPDFARGHLVDLGCGPADIPIRFCRALPGVTVTAVDGSEAMLAPGRAAVAAARLEARIRLVCARLPEQDLEIYWGAYLGTEDEILVSGTLRDVIGDIERARREARERKGWIMDSYLLRRPERGEA